MSTRYKIKDVRCEQPGDGFDMLLLVGEVTYETDNGETFVLSLSECDGMPTIYKTSKSIFGNLITQDYSEEVDSYIVYTSRDYERFLKDSANPLFRAMHYLIYIVQADWAESKKFIDETKGKFVDELTIPEIRVKM